MLKPAESESQTLRALLRMREMIVRGEFSPGERIREIPLSERLGVSRTPLRLVLERLEHEGLLEARPTVGFVVREFTIQTFSIRSSFAVFWRERRHASRPNGWFPTMNSWPCAPQSRKRLYSCANGWMSWRRWAATPN